jgi:hypothetical protein
MLEELKEHANNLKEVQRTQRKCIELEGHVKDSKERKGF